RMYLRWAEAHGHETEILDQTDGDEAGIKSVTVSVAGDYVYGYLRSERGVHRLVRLSPFHADKRRHTSFALVEVWPAVCSDTASGTDDKSAHIDPARAGGGGGHHVQKNDSSGRSTHLPTGIVVSRQSERNHTQNKQRPIHVHKARLRALEQQKRQEE